MNFDISNWFNYLDKHNGAFVALATIILCLVTAFYVVLTNRLVRTQYMSVKREIVEQIYQPLALCLSSITPTAHATWLGQISEPRFPWNELKWEHAFLAFHPLLPSRLRKELDHCALQYHHDALPAFKVLLEACDRAALLAVHGPLVPEVITVSARGWCEPDFSPIAAVLTDVAPEDVTVPHGLFGRTTIQIRFDLLDANDKTSYKVFEMEPRTWSLFISSLRDAINNNTEAAKCLETYLRFRDLATRLERRLHRQIERSAQM
jgi:hypothetical protein